MKGSDRRRRMKDLLDEGRKSHAADAKVSTDPTQDEIDQFLGCRTCGKDASGCVYCQACADKMPEYDFVLDDKNFDAGR